MLARVFPNGVPKGVKVLSETFLTDICRHHILHTIVDLLQYFELLLLVLRVGLLLTLLDHLVVVDFDLLDAFLVGLFKLVDE